MVETLNRMRTREARMLRRSRFISPPDTCVNITQKKCSGKETYNIFESRAQADLAIALQNHDPSPSSSNYWRDFGHRWKFRYRVNIYLKGDLHGAAALG